MAKRPKKSITLADLGKTLNLTPRAVSQALNGGDCTVRISEKTRQRVHALVKKLNYRPNRMAQILRKGDSGMVGILALQGFGYLIQQELFLAREYAEKNGYIPAIYLLPSKNADTCERAINFMLDSKVDAILVIGDILKPEQIQRLEGAGVPAVSIANPHVPGMPRYYADKQAGFRSLAEHLIEQGAARITLLISQNLPVPKRAWHALCAVDGALQAVAKAKKAGRTVDLEIVSNVNSSPAVTSDGQEVNAYYSNGYHGMKVIIQSGKIPDALMCQADNSVQGALLACAEHGIKVPQDMLITGFEDDAASSAGLLRITSVGQPMDEMVRLAFEDLGAINRGEKKMVSRSVKLPCKLVIRQSTIRAS